MSEERHIIIDQDTGPEFLDKPIGRYVGGKSLIVKTAEEIAAGPPPPKLPPISEG
jgi:hypothetical protein